MRMYEFLDKDSKNLDTLFVVWTDSWSVFEIKQKG